MSDCAVSLCEHVSPFSPFPDDHLGTLMCQIAAATAAGRVADVTGLLAAAVGNKRDWDLFSLQRTVFVRWSRLVKLRACIPVLPVF